MDDQQREISATTHICAVYGHPIKHSASPAMQNAGIAALGLNWRYLACDVHPEQLREAIKGAEAMRFIGLNLTVPHKLMALNFVDWVDEKARQWGAINTVRFEGQNGDGAWRPLAELPIESVQKTRSAGFNTDADAIIQSLEEDLQMRLQGSKVLLLGAGGAGRVAALKLAEAGVGELYLQNRTRSKVEELARELSGKFPNVAARMGYPDSNIDLVLNATSLGLKETDPLPFDPNAFQIEQAGSAYDMIYRPAETAFLKIAKSRGCNTANGMGMLLYQGAKSLEIWSGKKAPLAIMRQALHSHLYPAA
ncbi:MAG: shikimate dehydrogenase family protein [Verrucomicrobiales bacterium]